MSLHAPQRPPPNVHQAAIIGRSAQCWSASYGRGLTAAEREDVAQEVALRLWSTRLRYEPARSSFATFVDRAARHHALDVLDGMRSRRRGGRAVHVGLDDDLREPPRTDPDLIRAVHATVAALPEPDREICAALIDLPVAAAARELGLSRAALRRRIERIRAQFEAAGLDAWLEAA